MKENVKTLMDSFVDYKGSEHEFTVTVVCRELSGEKLPKKVSKMLTLEGVETYAVFTDGIHVFRAKVPYGVSIGIAICNPKDLWTPELGTNISYNRALCNLPTLYSEEMVSTKVLESIAKQEIQKIKYNPENYIAGYETAKRKYFENKDKEEIYQSLSEDEKTFVNKAKENPKILQKINTYLGLKS